MNWGKLDKETKSHPSSLSQRGWLRMSEGQPGQRPQPQALALCGGNSWAPSAPAPDCRAWWVPTPVFRRLQGHFIFKCHLCLKK